MIRKWTQTVLHWRRWKVIYKESTRFYSIFVFLPRCWNISQSWGFLLMYIFTPVLTYFTTSKRPKILTLCENFFMHVFAHLISVLEAVKSKSQQLFTTLFALSLRILVRTEAYNPKLRDWPSAVFMIQSSIHFRVVGIYSVLRTTMSQQLCALFHIIYFLLSMWKRCQIVWSSFWTFGYTRYIMEGVEGGDFVV